MSLECPRCGFKTHHKHVLKHHFSRKKPCDPHQSDIDFSTLLETFLSNERKINKHIPCSRCGKCFSSNQSKWRHIKEYCNGVSTDLVEQITQSLKDQKVGPNQPINITIHNSTQINSNNTTNNTTTSNNTITNNTVHINAFGKEDTSHITSRFLDQCVRRRDKGMVELVQKVHFDERAPHNRNLRITNKKQPFIQVHNGERWIHEHKNKVLNTLFENSHNMLQEHFEDNEEDIRETYNLSETWHHLIKEWLEKMSEKDKKTLAPVLADMYLLILNSDQSISGS